MKRSKALYLFLMVALFLFFVLYQDPLSLILLCLAAVLPLVLWLLLHQMKRMVSASLSVQHAAQAKHENTAVTITVRNRGVLPIAHLVVTLRYQNILELHSQEVTFHTVIAARDAQEIRFQMVSDYCGRLLLEISTCRVYDYLKLFSAKVLCHEQQEILILPQLWPMELVLAELTDNSLDSSVFSKHRSGDDPSEVFAYQDYQPGDKISRINWKLSTKQDTTIVKQYSLPVQNAICLLLEWSSSEHSAARLDAMVEAAFSISDFLTSQEVFHSICWYHAAQTAFAEERISDPEDLSVTIGRLFLTRPDALPGDALRALDPDAPISHLLYLTDSLTESNLRHLELLRAGKITVFYLTEHAQQSEIPEHSPAISVLPLVLGDLSTCVQDLVI